MWQFLKNLKQQQQSQLTNVKAQGVDKQDQK